MTVYYACPVCQKPYDVEEACHLPDDFCVAHTRPDGGHWFELVNGHILRDWLIKVEPKPPTANESSTRQWEYCVVPLGEGAISVLNSLGKDGWELASTDNSCGYLKRKTNKPS